jgi:hypothetical protein
MKKLKVNFVDFWPFLYKTDNYFYNLLSLKYDVEIDEENPDVLFFSVDYENTQERYKYKDCLKIFYTGENLSPNFQECDIAFSFQRSNDPKNYRLPLWALHLNWFNRPYIEQRDQAYLHSLQAFLKNKNQTHQPTPLRNLRHSWHRRSFCSFVAVQPKGERVSFVPQLSNSYKKVSCGGSLFNNIHDCHWPCTETRFGLETIQGRGDQVHKIDFLDHFKFNVAFENCSSEGYVTEKIIHAMFANSIPIYWGDPTIHLDFNKNSFLSLHDFENHEELIEKVKEIDQDDKKYQDMLAEPWFTNNEIPDFVQPENVLSWLEKHLP